MVNKKEYKMSINIAIHGSHNSALAIERDGKILAVIEVERFSGYKNGGLAQYKVTHNNEVIYREILRWIRDYYGIERFDTCYYSNTQIVHDEVQWRMEEYIPADVYQPMKHHEAHANGTFYQSTFDEAIIFSFDGGGSDGFWNIYRATRKEGAILLAMIRNPIQNSDHIQYDLGLLYMVIGQYLGDIKQEFL